jgi:transposase
VPAADLAPLSDQQAAQHPRTGEWELEVQPVETPRQFQVGRRYMESTSVYWIPIFELLDARGFILLLVNARDAKHVPGRKTDVSDAQWLQRLHSYGLLRASFRPKGQIAELRAYVRRRERLLE